MSLVLKPFHLFRHEDASGISGTGIVAVGVVWPNGRATMHWISYRSSSEDHASIDSLMEIHGHGGKTEIVYGVPYDPAAPPPKPKRTRRKKAE